MAKEIKSKEDIQEVVNDQDEKLTALDAKLTETEAEKTEMAAKLETATNNVADLIEQVKTLHLNVVAKDTWKEDPLSEEAIAYGIGSMVKDMIQGQIHGSQIAGPRLLAAGARPTSKREDSGWDENKDVIIPTKDVKNPYEWKAGLSSSPLTGDDSVGSYNGSYTVPVTYLAELERIALDNSAMMNLVRRINVAGITTYLPYTEDELAFTAVTNQNTDKTEDTLTVTGRRTLTTVTYAAYIAVVEEYFEDSLVDIGMIVRDMFGEAWGKNFDSLALENSTYGAVATADNNVTMDTGDVAFSNVSIDDLDNMVKQLATRAKRNNIQYFMTPTVWDYIAEEKDADGNYRMRDPHDMSQLRAHGRPVVLTDGMPDVPNDSAVSTKFVGLGDPRQIWNGNRVGYEFRIYDQTQSAMESGQIFLRVRTRQAFVTAMQNAWVSLTTAAS